MDTATAIGVVCGITLGTIIVVLVSPYIDRVSDWLVSKGRGE